MNRYGALTRQFKKRKCYNNSNPMKKNAVIFFCAVIVNLIAVFLFLATPPQAHAYAMSSAVGGNYNIGNSFQGLIFAIFPDLSII